MDAGANCGCVWIPPGGLSEASFVITIIEVLFLHLYFCFNIQNCLISAVFMKSILTLILCNVVIYEMVNK